MKEVELKLKDNSDITEALQKEIERNKDLSNVVILLPKGCFRISATIWLFNGSYLRGAADWGTKIKLVDKTNNNMFTNVDYNKGNNNIVVENLWLDGNSSKQFKPENEDRLSFCNIFYFKNVYYIRLLNIKAINCKQTAMHFNNSKNVFISKLYARRMGWSGISTSGVDDIRAVGIQIIDSGRETRHSAVHFDGGTGSYFEGIINKCTGNGIMLDSKYFPLKNSIIHAKCTSCKRGIAIFGTQDSLISNVLIEKSYLADNEIGILVSNTYNIYISDCNIYKSSKFGISFQGKYGNKNILIFKNNFLKNKEDLRGINTTMSFMLNNINKVSRSLLKSLLIRLNNFSDTR